MRAARPRCALVAAALAVAAACARPAQVRYEERLAGTPAAARHAVHSDRLAELMRLLEEQWVARMPQAMDMELERERRLDDLIQVLRAMADSAARIPATLALPADEPARGEFLRLAEQLREGAAGLADAAPRLSPDALRGRAQAIERTCAECHRRFRIPRAPDG